jgi:hypothetical protein
LGGGRREGGRPPKNARIKQAGAPPDSRTDHRAPPRSSARARGPPPQAGISAIRRLRKTDNNRIARATGATIVHRPEEIRESDIGTGAGLFEVVKIGGFDRLTP